MDLHNINNNDLNTGINKNETKKQQTHFKSKNKADSFEYSSKSKKAQKNKNKKKSKKYGKLALLAALALSIQSCNSKNNTNTNAYNSIGSPVVDLKEYSEEYFYEYNNSDNSSEEAKKAVEKAESYYTIPVIGDYLYTNKGMDTIQDAIASEGNKINGYIDNDIAQGIVSDCWLITPIENLSYTPLGAQMLHDALSLNEDGNIDVYFTGPDLACTVTIDEIKNANKEYSIYTRGDDDMLVYELAVEKFRQDLVDNKIFKDENLPSYLYYTNTDGYSALRLGETRQAYWLITGITDSIEAKTEDEINEVLEKYKESPETSLLDVELKKDAKVKDINGDTIYIYGSHGYGVKEITDDTITLICASYSNKEITLSLNTLKELPIDCLVYCELIEE